MFFKQERHTFFRPLNGKWREITVACIQELYARLYSPEADYTDHVSRPDLRDMFLYVIRKTPVMEAASSPADTDSLPGIDPSSEQALASSLINVLEKEGWLERYTDKAALLTAFRFSRAGKLFAEAFLWLDNPRGKTRQRNVRNTRNALQAFRETLDAYDLIDALEYSQRVVLDISDDIAFLNELKQDLLTSAMRNTAVEDFLAFMEKHFRPDLSVRLAADSVEKHRTRIMEIIEDIRLLPRERFEAVEPKIRALLTSAEIRTKSRYLVLDVLDRIERTIDAACEAKLPQLRAALNGFIKRSALITKQATAIIAGMGTERISQAIDAVAALPAEAQEARLAAAGLHMQMPVIRLPDPAAFRARRPIERQTAATVTTLTHASREALLAAAIAEAEAMAFAVSPTHIKRDLIERLQGETHLQLSQLPAGDVTSILTLVHAIEAVSATAEQGDRPLEIAPLHTPFATPYLTLEDFVIRNKDE